MVKRKRVKEPFGWAKAMGLMRRQRHRGRPKVQWRFRLTAAVFNVTLRVGMAGAAFLGGRTPRMVCEGMVMALAGAAWKCVDPPPASG